MEKEEKRFKVVDSELLFDQLRYILDISRPPPDFNIIEKIS